MMIVSLAHLLVLQTFIGVDVRDRITRLNLENVLFRRGFTFTQVSSLQLNYVVNAAPNVVAKVLEREMPSDLFGLSYEGRKLQEAAVPTSPGVEIATGSPLRFPFDVEKILKLTGKVNNVWTIDFRPIAVWIDKDTQKVAFDIYLTSGKELLRFQALPSRKGGLEYHPYRWPQPGKTSL
ncbi:MAG: hypothetical protein H7Y17_16360 [Chlorobia bacterium]|nr:hypothetical protein [Fimbriimonadaceae bacterium]